MLRKDLVDDAAGSGVDAPDDSPFASRLIEKDDPIPQHPQAIKSLQLAFERADVSLLSFQVLEAAPENPSRFGRQRTDEIDDLPFQFNLDQAHQEFLPDSICPFLRGPAAALS